MFGFITTPTSTQNTQYEREKMNNLETEAGITFLSTHIQK